MHSLLKQFINLLYYFFLLHLWPNWIHSISNFDYHILFFLQYYKGHCWPRAIPNNYHCLLSRCNGFHSHVWHHKWREFQLSTRLVSLIIKMRFLITVQKNKRMFPWSIGLPKLRHIHGTMHKWYWLVTSAIWKMKELFPLNVVSNWLIN